MNEEKLNQLFEYYKCEQYGRVYIIENYFEQLINRILTLHRLDMAELEAKVYVYEKIIANSNFSTLLKENKKLKGGVKMLILQINMILTIVLAIAFGIYCYKVDIEGNENEKDK